MTVSQILAQVIAVVIIIIMAVGAQAKTQRSFLFFQLIINVLYCVHYGLLSATTATVVCVICVIRTLIFYLYRRKDKTVPIWLLIIILLAVIGSGIATWEGWLSTLPIIATILFTFGQWQKDIRITRIFVIAGDLSWIAYNIFCLAYVDILGRSVEALSCVVAMLRYRRSDLKKQLAEMSPNITPIREVKFLDTQEISEAQLKIAVIAARYKNKWIFCKQKTTGTWELPSGHKEENETILETAKRELNQKTGACQFDITPICVYYVTKHAMLFYAQIEELADLLPDKNEIECIDLFTELPENLTLPQIHPKLFEKAEEFLSAAASKTPNKNPE